MYISKLISDSYESKRVPNVTMHCMIRLKLSLALWVQGVSSLGTLTVIRNKHRQLTINFSKTLFLQLNNHTAK